MKKNIIQLLSLSSLVALAIGFSSCDKDDEPPPVKPNLSFAAPTMTVNEADGSVDIEVVLDNPAPEDIVIEYSLAGNARDKATVAPNAAYDYEVLSDVGEIAIAKGETTGTIQLMLISDYFAELDETIEIAITDVDNENIEITREDEVVITVKQEDGIVISLSWPAPTADSTADMDILVRKGATTAAWDEIVAGSVQEGYVAPEFVFIPKAFNDVAFGLSYVYWDGTMNSLPLTVRFVDLIDGAFEAEAGYEVFEGTYKLANRHMWTEQTINETIVVQTFKKSGGVPVEISEISVPATSSRWASSGQVTTTLKRQSDMTMLPEKFRILANPLNRD